MQETWRCTPVNRVWLTDAHANPHFARGWQCSACRGIVFGSVDGRPQVLWTLLPCGHTFSHLPPRCHSAHAEGHYFEWYACIVHFVPDLFFMVLYGLLVLLWATLHYDSIPLSPQRFLETVFWTIVAVVRAELLSRVVCAIRPTTRCCVAGGGSLRRFGSGVPHCSVTAAVLAGIRGVFGQRVHDCPVCVPFLWVQSCQQAPPAAHRLAVAVAALRKRRCRGHSRFTWAPSSRPCFGGGCTRAGCTTCRHAQGVCSVCAVRRVFPAPGRPEPFVVGGLGARHNARLSIHGPRCQPRCTARVHVRRCTWATQLPAAREVLPSSCGWHRSCRLWQSCFLQC